VRRVLIIADPVNLPELARELDFPADFEFVSLPPAEAIGENSFEAALIFHGGECDAAETLGKLAPKRAAGQFLFAVLPATEAALRADCFDAQASDVFFLGGSAHRAGPASLAPFLV
jgi:hypothetical protein